MSNHNLQYLIHYNKGDSMVIGQYFSVVLIWYLCIHNINCMAFSNNCLVIAVAMFMVHCVNNLILDRSYWHLLLLVPIWLVTETIFLCTFKSIISYLFFYSEVAKGLMKYQPDIIISVHPLMQHVPLRILRAKGLLKKIVFTTVITDLSTCHPTWLV